MIRSTLLLMVLLLVSGCASGAGVSVQETVGQEAPLALSRTLLWYAQFRPAALLLGGPARVRSDPGPHLRGRAFLVERNRCGREIQLEGPALAGVLGRYTRVHVPVVAVEVKGAAEPHRLDRSLVIPEGECPGDGAGAGLAEELPEVDYALVERLFAAARGTLARHWGSEPSLIAGIPIAWRFPGGETQLWVDLMARMEEGPTRRFALVGAELVAPDSLRVLVVEPMGVREIIQPVAALDVDGDDRPEVLAFRSLSAPNEAALGLMVFRGGPDGWHRWKEVTLWETRTGGQDGLTGREAAQPTGSAPDGTAHPPR